MALSTKGLPAAGKIAKTIRPGIILAKIVQITLTDDRFNPEQNGKFINLTLEGVDLTDQGFEGFFIDKNDESKGRHKGQSGIVKTTAFSYRDANFSGREVKRDDKILEFFRDLAKELGKSSELANIEAETIEEYVPLASNVLSGDKFIYFSVGGKEYESKGYTNYELFLVPANYKARKFPFAAEEMDLEKFDSKNEKHFRSKKPAETVSTFAPANEELATADATFEPVQEFTSTEIGDDLPF